MIHFLATRIKRHFLAVTVPLDDLATSNNARSFQSAVGYP
ncbi:hypothetical protein SKA58_01455 [Sphingomonas sp. SKA58]|nr:hypothetical protein SKA58_01455 [Sphingomonas sp. SKA58]|tara:strand:- start:280 stop:399 length:120 start_codon:yes stop_codon:yes gene_type:complete